MDLKRYTHNLIYEGKDMPLSDNLARFKIVCPEYAPHEIEVKPYPIPAAEHIFALMWDISPQHVVSATLLPSASHFLPRSSPPVPPLLTRNGLNRACAPRCTHMNILNYSI